MNKNIIELNGKRYDALTGAFLGKSTHAPVASTAKPAAHKAASGKQRVIDGFIRPVSATSHAAAPANAKAAPHAKASPSVPEKVEHVTEKTTTHAAHSEVKPEGKATVKVEKVAEKKLNTSEKKVTEKPAAAATKSAPLHKVHVAAPAHVIRAHQPQHAKTLMGRVLKKPVFSLKPAIKPQAPAEVAAPPLSILTHKRSVISVDPDRMVRAQHVPKHKAVSRFHKLSGHTAISTFHHEAPQTVVPIIAVQPAPIELSYHKPPAKLHTDIFEAAIAKATSHTQPAHRIKRSTRRKVANALAGGGALLLIAGFVTFLNIPNIEVHVASIQAGFHASMPSYMPVGYALAGHVQRTGNTVSMRFRSGANNFTLTQQPSDWDNEAILENTLPLQSSHQTIEVGGRTVYVYDNTNAVWVAGNVRYDLIGNAPLDTSDISHLAMSL